MTKDSQMKWTRRQLLKKGYVTRNESLKRYFNRLSARIYDLRREGMKIQGYWKKTKNGRDYVYQLVK